MSFARALLVLAVVACCSGCAVQVKAICAENDDEWQVIPEPANAAGLIALVQQSVAKEWDPSVRSFWLQSRDGKRRMLCRGHYTGSSECSGRPRSVRRYWFNRHGDTWRVESDFSRICLA